MFLTPDQLRELTGYRMPAYQVRWLQRNGVRHFVRADGRPSVPVEAVTGPAAAEAARKPEWRAIERRG